MMLCRGSARSFTRFRYSLTCKNSQLKYLPNIHICTNVRSATSLHAYKTLLPCSSSYILLRKYSKKDHETDECQESTEPASIQKKTLFQRFKQMYRDYWYVLVPVHLVTSAAWFGGFYYLAKSGIDIAGLLESWHVSSKITNSLKDSSMGYIAVSYALYKLATPVRYTVTLGGTTMSITYLKRWGYIKPVPSKEQLKELYTEKRNNIMESFREKREIYKEKRQNIIETMRDKKKDLGVQDDFKAEKQDLASNFGEKRLAKVKKV